MANKNRTKGHNYERLWVKHYKEAGYEWAKTTRAASRLLDNSKVDIAFIPFNHQCKSVKRNINYFSLIHEIEEALNKNYPPGHEQIELPIVISHKKDFKNEVVVMKPSLFLDLIKIKKEWDDARNNKEGEGV